MPDLKDDYDSKVRQRIWACQAEGVRRAKTERSSPKENTHTHTHFSSSLNSATESGLIF